MTRVLHAEWVKLRTMPSSGWLLLAFATAIVALGAAVTSTVDVSQCRLPTECFEDTTKLSLSGVWVGQVAAVAVGALAITNEYGTGMIHTTLTAIPQRGRLLAGKAAVVVGDHAPGRHDRGLGIAVGRPQHPAGQRVQRRQRLSPVVPGRRIHAARRCRHRRLPRAASRARARDRHDDPRLSGGDHRDAGAVARRSPGVVHDQRPGLDRAPG